MNAAPNFPPRTKIILVLLFAAASCFAQSTGTGTVQIPSPIPSWGGYLGAGTVTTPTDFGAPICRGTDGHSELNFDGTQDGANFSENFSGSNVDHRISSNHSLVAIARNGSSNSLIESVTWNGGPSCGLSFVYTVPSKSIAFSGQASKPKTLFDVESAAIKKFDFGDTATGTPATITSFSITSNVVTVVAPNSFVAGQSALISGLTVGTYLNGSNLIVLTAGLSSSHFEAAFTHANVTSTAASGTATPSCTLTGPCVTLVHDFAAGTCLSGIAPTSNSVFLQSHLDQFFAIGFSIGGGQGTGTLISTFLIGSGERVLNSGGTTVMGIPASSVCGDYGPTGVINMVGGNCPAAGAGTCGTCPGGVVCPDQSTFHEVYASPNDTTPWLVYDLGATCTQCGSDGDWVWSVATLNETAPSWNGHFALGYNHIVIATNNPSLGENAIFQAIDSSGNLIFPITKLSITSTSSPNNLPSPGVTNLDNHPAWQNVNPNDTNSVYETNTVYRTDTADLIANYVASGEPPSSMPGVECGIACLPTLNSIPGYGVNELLSSPLTDPPGNDTPCSTSPCTTKPKTRYAHELNDTVSALFNAQNAIGGVSPDGMMFAFTTTAFCGLGDTTNDSNGICGGPTWNNSNVYHVGNIVSPLGVGNPGHFTYQVTACSGTCTSGASAPTWTQSAGAVVIDNAGANQVTWTASNTQNMRSDVLFVWLATPGVPVSNAATPAPSQSLCTTDSISIAPSHRNLREGTHLVNLTWGGLSPAPDWYRVYRSQVSGGPYTVIADCLRSAAYTDPNVVDTQTYFYVVTDFLMGGESSFSNEISASIPTFDTISVSYTGPLPNFFETLNTSASVAAHHAGPRTASETLTISDAIVTSSAHFRLAQETLTTNGAMASNVTGPLAIGLTEDIRTSDSISRLSVFGRSAGESLSTSDSPLATVNVGGDPACIFTSDCNGPSLLTVDVLQKNGSPIAPGSLVIPFQAGAVHGICYSATARDIILAQNVSTREQFLSIQNQADRLGRTTPQFSQYPVDPGISMAIQMRRQVGWALGGQICFNTTNGLNISVVRYR